MSAEQWERIKTLFESALKLPEGERADYLAAACAGQPEVRRTVEELLANHDDCSEIEIGPLPNFLEEPVFAPGQLVAGRFRVVRFLTRGGMGEVYEAYDERLRVRLALKTLRPELASDVEALERFRREIRVSRHVAHDNLCRIYDLVEHTMEKDGCRKVVPCLTMGLLDGETLQDRLRRERPLPKALALSVARDVAGALAELHSHGIVHRDLKPSNIMLVPEPDGGVRAVVMDFGLTRPLQASEGDFETRTNGGAGSPYFMAPELLQGGRPSVASDVYALGLVIDEMATRSRAYTAESLQSLYYQKLWERPLPPSDRAESLPAGWEAILLQCIDAEPKRRFSSVLEVTEALTRAGSVADITESQAWWTGVARRLEAWRTCGSPFRWTFRGWPLALGALLPALLLLNLLISGLSSQPAGVPVVVYPIANLTQRADLDYLCQGTTDELVRLLSQVKGVLAVSVREPRPNGLPRTLNGKLLLEGRLQEFNGQVRLSVQLLDGHDGAVRWADVFDRPLANPLLLQTEIARGTVRAVQATATLPSPGASEARFGLNWPRVLLAQAWHPVGGVGGPPTASNTAMNAYMRGRHLWEEMTVPSSLAAIRHFETALREDSSFALAHAAIADAVTVLLDHNHAPGPTLLARAREHAERGAALGPEFPETHLSLAAVQQMAWEWEAAEASYQTALRLNPSHPRAHRWFAGLLLQFGRFEEALSHASEALRLNPEDSPSQAAYGLYLLYASRPMEAVAHLQRVVRSSPILYAHIHLGDAYARLATLSSGDLAAGHFAKAFEQARIVAERERAALPASGSLLRFSDRMYALYFALQGNRTEAQPYLDRLVADMDAGRTTPVVIAWILTALGERDRALGLLETALAQRDRRLLYARVIPYLEPLRSEPRFQAVLARMRL